MVNLNSLSASYSQKVSSMNTMNSPLANYENINFVDLGIFNYRKLLATLCPSGIWCVLVMPQGPNSVITCRIDLKLGENLSPDLTENKICILNNDLTITHQGFFQHF